MQAIKVVGGKKLVGEIAISTAKNAVLPIMAASLLVPGKTKILDYPRLVDVTTMAELLTSFGCQVSVEGLDMVIDASNISNLTAHYDIVSRMRASICVLGPMLARFGKAKISLPGGCAIGARPVDMHINALEKMGAKISIDHGYISAEAPNGLAGAEINFDKISVGATENIIMAAVLAKGRTIIRNPALEPEVIDLANMLQAMGADIKGLGSKEIIIDGVKELKNITYRPIPDRIEAGTYMVAAAITGGKIKLTKMIPSHLAMFIEKMRAAGAHIEIGEDFVIVEGRSEIKPVNIETAGYPAFPTDLQAQFMSLMLISSGTSCIKETVFENRFMHALELKRFGADITIEGGSVFVKGVPKLCGATVMATDLRASVSLILAALTIAEDSIISRVYHLDRGYEGFEEKLRSCGADIVRINYDSENVNQSVISMV